MIALSDRQKQVYRVIANNPGITSKQLCALFGCQRQSLIDRIRNMEAYGLIKSDVKDNHGTKEFRVDRRHKVIT